MNEILVIGASNVDTNYYVDKLPVIGGSVHTIAPKRNSLGGKGLNQSVAIAKAEGIVSFISCVGNDSNGALIKESLSAIENLKPHLEIVDLPTGEATILVDKNGENEVIVNSGANIKLNIDVLKKNAKLFAKAKCLVIQNEMPFDTIKWIFEHYGESKHIFYNPSPLHDIPEKIYPLIGTLVVNKFELLSLTKANSIKEAIEVLSMLNLKSVLLTLGSAGSEYYEGNSLIYKAEAEKVNAIDTVGAGDTYLGYFVAGLSRGLGAIESMNLATYASALSVTKEGAFASIPTLEEIFEFLENS